MSSHSCQDPLIAMMMIMVKQIGDIAFTLGRNKNL